jgi:uncharacterized repeat protein (TIGR01451 family)
MFSTLTVLVMLLSPLAVGAGTDESAAPVAPNVVTGLIVKNNFDGVPIPVQVDGSTHTVAFSVDPIDAPPGAFVTHVRVDIMFFKTSNPGGCKAVPPPGGGPDWAEEIGFTLRSPALNSVDLVTPTDLTLPPPPPPPWNGYVSGPDVYPPVIVTFDDVTGVSSVAGSPILRSPPEFWSTLRNLNTFDNQSVFGVWNLDITDLFVSGTFGPEFLCYVSSNLNIDYQANEFDLTIEKFPSTAGGQPDNGPVMAGEEMFWTVRGQNNGVDTAHGVRVYDYLPQEFVFLGAEPYWERMDPQPGEPPNMLPGGTWYWFDLGDIPPGGYEFHIKTLVSPDAIADKDTGTLTMNNYARVESVDIEPDPSNNEVWSSPVFIEDLADLKVTKMSKPDTQVQAGEPFTYTIFVDNLGPSFARYVWVQDKILSSGDFSLDSFVSNRDVYCEVTGAGFDCQLLGPLEPQGFLPEGPPPERWTIQVQVTANETQDINNEVNVFTLDDPYYGFLGTPDPDMSNNQAIDFISVLDVADLSVTKAYEVWTEAGWISPGYATAGLSIRYTLTVTNNTGPSTAENVLLMDSLPAGVSLEPDTLFINGVPGQGSCISGTPSDPLEPLTCGLGELPPGGEPIVVQFQVLVDPSIVDGTVLENDAWVASDIFDPDNSNNYAFNQTHVLTAADLGIYKTAAPDPWWSGDVYEYFIEVWNGGPSVARHVVIQDLLPSTVEFVSATLDNNVEVEEADCELYPGNFLKCNLGDMLLYDSFELTVKVRVKDGVSGTITNGANVVSDTIDPVGSNDNSSVVTTVQETYADLYLEKVAEGGVWHAGEEHSYILTVRNDGPAIARTLVVEDQLPNRVEFVSATLDTGEGFIQPDCGLTAQNKLRCYLEELQPGEINRFIIKVHILPGYYEVIRNEARVSSTIYDPYPGDNYDYADKPIQEYIDLAITKTAPQHVYAGEEMFYDITVTNLGATPVEDVDVVDQLPMFDEDEPLVIYLGSTGDVDEDYGDDCYFDDEYNQVYCDLYFYDDLDPGESFTFQIKVLVRPDLLSLVWEAGLDGTFEMLNEAWLDIEDENEDNNYAEAVTIVEDQADLRVIKMSKPDTQVRAGELFTYTILVDNLGPSSSRGVWVQDNILSSGDFTVIDVIDDRSELFAAEGNLSKANSDWTSYLCGIDFIGPEGPDSPAASQVIECSLFIFPLEPQGWYPEEWVPITMPSAKAPLQDELLSGRWTIQIVVQANETQDINNIVDVYTMNVEFDGMMFRGTPDPDMSNNQAIDFITVLDASDLELTKSVIGEWQYGEIYLSDTMVSRGMPLTYTLTISNTGASTAENVVLQDNLPVEPYILSITPSQGRCFRGVPGDLSKPMTCNLGTLAPGTGVTVTVVTIVPEETALGTLIYNEAWIFSDMFDPDTSNNIDSRTILVIERIKSVIYLPVIQMLPTTP